MTMTIRLTRTIGFEDTNTIGYYDLGATSLLIRGYDPLADAVAYGRDLIPRVRALVAERDAARRDSAAL